MVDGEATSDIQDATVTDTPEDAAPADAANEAQSAGADWQALAGQLQTALDDAVTGLGEANRQLAAVTAERDALAAAADAAAKAPRSTTKASAKARKCGVLKVAPTPEELLAAIGEAELVELVFSDGTAEIPTLPARMIEGDAWTVILSGLALRLPELLIEGPGPGVLNLAGYGLFLDGKQVAWGPRPEVLAIAPGARMNLQGDVLFGAG